MTDELTDRLIAASDPEGPVIRETAAEAAERIADLREKLARAETENEVLRAGAAAKRRPLVDTQAAIAIGLIAAGIVLTIWSTLDPEVAFTGIAGLLAGGGLVATGKALG